MSTELNATLQTEETLNATIEDSATLNANLSIGAYGVSSWNGETGDITYEGVTSFNGSTGDITFTAPVTSVNGQTGAVTCGYVIQVEIGSNDYVEGIDYDTLLASIQNMEDVLLRDGSGRYYHMRNVLGWHVYWVYHIPYDNDDNLYEEGIIDVNFQTQEAVYSSRSIFILEEDQLSGVALSGSYYDLEDVPIVTEVDEDSGDDEIPSAKCLYDLVGDVETLLASI